MIRNDFKLGQGPTSEGWCLYQTCPTGTSNWHKLNLSQWDKQIGISCACPGQTGCLYQVCLTGTRKGQKRPLLVPWDKSYTHAGVRDKFYTHDTACPRTICRNFSTNCVYKTVEREPSSSKPLQIYTLLFRGLVPRSLWVLFNH